MDVKLLKISCKWNLDSGGSIYEINGQLLFYTQSQDPCWTRGQEVPYNEVMKTKCYKQKEYRSWDDIPNDCSMSF